jgi:glycosyltransferase involved in cell wall biosynthesis
MADRPRILAIGYAHPGFGFGRVLHSLLSRLTRTYDVHQFELSAHDVTSRLWTVHRSPIGGDRWGLYALPSLITSLRPALIFFVGEIWYLSYYASMVHSLIQPPHLIGYCPIDGPLLQPHSLRGLTHISCLVLYTEFAMQVVSHAWKQLQSEGYEADMPRRVVIPHGVDTALFHPLSSESQESGRQKARHRLRAVTTTNDPACLENDFVVLNANRNQPRKRVDLTIQAFQLFAADKPANVKLYLHMGITDEGCNILGQAKKYDLLDRIVLTSRSQVHPEVSDEELNTIYNACDIGLNTSGGEGWGLCSFEHAATKAAQIVPDHTACAELWRGAALQIGVPETSPTWHPMVELLEVSVDDTSAALEHLYVNQTFRHQMAVAAYRNATRPEYQWNAVAARFAGLFEDVING